MQLLMGFDVYMPAGTMVGNIEFNKGYWSQKVLHTTTYDSVHFYVATNLTNLFYQISREGSTSQRHIWNSARYVI